MMLETDKAAITAFLIMFGVFAGVVGGYLFGAHFGFGWLGLASAG